MKKKKVLPLIILLAILIALIAAYVLLSGYNEKKAAEKAAATEEQELEITVCTIDSADATAISYKTEELDMTLSLSDGTWIIPDDENYPIDQTAVTKMLSAVTALTAEREVEGSNPADFGLGSPSLTVTVTVSGEEIVFTLGDVNSYNDLTYLGYNGKVYMISDTLTDAFDYDKADLFAAEDTFPSAIDSDSVTSVTVTNRQGDSATVSDSDGIEDAVFDTQKYISFAILKGYGLDADGLASYGITENSENLVIEYDYNGAKATFTVLFGKNADGDCFYTVPGSKCAYGIDAAGYDKLMAYAYYTPAETTADTTAEVADE